MDAERIHKLNLLDFRWEDLNEKHWNKMYGRLEAYKRKNKVRNCSFYCVISIMCLTFITLYIFDYAAL